MPESLPLYEGVDWNGSAESYRRCFSTSPSLRGSGLKSSPVRAAFPRDPVSLFTREWIEMPFRASIACCFAVSLFTREWIEIWVERYCRTLLTSPSLRGSGLKLRRWRCLLIIPIVSLFTREWIEITRFCLVAYYVKSVSLFTREWIEILEPTSLVSEKTVSLFTREWIEIDEYKFLEDVRTCLPLYEGVDWNCPQCQLQHLHMVSLFTREWIEITFHLSTIPHPMSPSLRGSGLKLL